MKRILFLLSMLFVFVAAQAQTTRTLTPMNSGTFQGFNLTFADTIESGETLNFVAQVKHLEQTAIAIQQAAKVVANDTTIALTIYESMDGVAWTILRYNSSGSEANLGAYTLAKGAVNSMYCPDVAGAYLRARYIRLSYTAPTKSGFKKIVAGYLKLNTL